MTKLTNYFLTTMSHQVVADMCIDSMDTLNIPSTQDASGK